MYSIEKAILSLTTCYKLYEVLGRNYSLVDFQNRPRQYDYNGKLSISDMSTNRHNGDIKPTACEYHNMLCKHC